MMVWLLSPYFEKKLNLEKLLKLALVHDLVEIYAGDTFSFDFEGRKTKQQREEKAAKKLFKQLPEPLRKDFESSWREYEGKKTKEAFFTQSIDKLQPYVQNILVNGLTFKKFKITEELIRKHKSHYNDGSEFLTNIFEELMKQNKKMNPLNRG